MCAKVQRADLLVASVRQHDLRKRMMRYHANLCRLGIRIAIEILYETIVVPEITYSTVGRRGIIGPHALLQLSRTWQRIHTMRTLL